LCGPKWNRHFLVESAETFALDDCDLCPFDAGADVRSPVEPEPASSELLEVPDRFVRAESLEIALEDQATVAPSPIQMAPAEHDGTLIEIYRTEVANHIAAIRAWVAARGGRQAPHPVSEDLYRACHTLAGASRMAGMAQGTELAEPLNLVIRRFHDQVSGLPDEALSLLLDYADAFSQVADSSRSRVSREQAEALQIRLMALESAASYIVQTNSGEAPEEAATQSEMVIDATATGSFATIDFDPEIAAIFSDEASELLESAARAVDRLEQNPRDGNALTALKRYLHTLKGGARMAGVPAIGELAHEFESLLTRSEPLGSLGGHDLGAIAG
jgi:chemotaxis protein histidine kinase CheA